MTYFGQTGRS